MRIFYIILYNNNLFIDLVSIGAAILAASLEKRADMAPLLVQNVIPLSIGILCKDHVIHKVIKRNTVYPNETKCRGRTIIDNQKKFLIAIYEGEHSNPAYNKKLGSLNLEGIEIASAGNTIKIPKNKSNNSFFDIQNECFLTIII